MAKGKKTPIDMSSFVVLHMRAFIEAQDVYEISFVAVLAFWRLWRGRGVGLGKPAIGRIGRMSPSTVKRVAARLVKREWIAEFEDPSTSAKGYLLILDDIDLQEAFRVAAQKWLPTIKEENPQLDIFALLSEGGLTEPGGGPDRTGGPHSTPQRPVRPTDEKDLHNTKSNKESDSALIARRKAFTGYFWKRYSEKHDGQLPDPPPWKWMWQRANAMVDRFDDAELKRRVDNYMDDPYLTSHPFEDFVKTPDKWIQLRHKFSGGNSGSFNQSGTGDLWRPRD